MLPTVSIIGLGWLGLPLALRLQSKGFDVTGSVTSEEKCLRLREQGISCRVLSVAPASAGGDYKALFSKEVLVINISPGIPPSVTAPDPTLYASQIATVRDLAVAHGVKWIIYVSSTSVYPDNNGIVRESDVLTAETAGSRSIFLAEEAIKASDAYALTIVRMGGLIGYDRIPGKHFAGKEQVAGHPPVNYIHRDDAAALIEWVISRQLRGEIFNGIAPAHPSRKDVYGRNADLLSFAHPASYEHPGHTPWKEVSADKLTEAGFTFSYPDPMQFSYSK